MPTVGNLMKFLAIFGLFSIVAAIGASSTDFLSSSDINNVAGFQVDQVASGSGFSALLRNSTNFFTNTLPNAISVNVPFLQGKFEIIRWYLILILAAIPLAIGLAILGIIRNNIG